VKKQAEQYPTRASGLDLERRKLIDAASLEKALKYSLTTRNEQCMLVAAPDYAVVMWS
jgi:hypothetical protein